MWRKQDFADMNIGEMLFRHRLQPKSSLKGAIVFSTPFA
jgi:hypothetical protein